MTEPTTATLHTPVGFLRKIRPAAALLFAVFLLPSPSHGDVIDRIAAIVEREVITVSEVSQMVTLHFFARRSGEAGGEYRRRVLDAMIAQMLRDRDVERFGAEEMSKEAIEARLTEIVSRFPSRADFDRALAETELTLDEVRALIKRQLQVEAYIDERFSPLIFVSLDEIEHYYSDVWSVERRNRGLSPRPLAEVREEIRDVLKKERLQAEIDKWTAQLRERANVDIYTDR
jgi:hypothetical protein